MPSSAAMSTILAVDDPVLRGAMVLRSPGRSRRRELLIEAGHIAGHIRATLENRLGISPPRQAGGHDQSLACTGRQATACRCRRAKRCPARMPRRWLRWWLLTKDCDSRYGVLWPAPTRWYGRSFFGCGSSNRAVLSHTFSRLPIDRLVCPPWCRGFTQSNRPIHHTVIGERQRRRHYPASKASLDHLRQLAGPRQAGCSRWWFMEGDGRPRRWGRQKRDSDQLGTKTL